VHSPLHAPSITQMRARTFRNVLLLFSVLLLFTCGVLAVLVYRIRKLESALSATNDTIVFQNFPETGRASVGQMLLPIVLSTGLLVFMSVFGALLYYFYRQRYWNGLQKEFVNNLMHEFRTPVSVISIASKVLQAEEIEFQPARLKQYAGIIKMQTQDLELKSDQVMNWALMEERSIHWQKEEVNISTLITDAIHLLQPLIEEKSALVHFAAPDEHIHIHVDAGYVTQAIVNLLDNSLKYAHRPQIQVTTEITNKSCAVSVSDNGIGIEKKYYKHIFRKFYRVPTGNIHNVKGFGIGLNFVKKVVDAHNGRIEVSSVKGSGTKFTIHLPLSN
jgi:two-component system phosphate regulon sensor histidine kinase PhoR